MSETLAPPPPSSRITISEADLFEDIPGPEIVQRPLSDRVAGFQGRLDQLSAVYGQVSADPSAVDEDLKMHISHSLHEASREMLGIVVAAEKAGDRDALRSVALGMIDSYKMRSEFSKQHPDARLTADASWSHYEETMAPIALALKYGDFAFPKGYYGHEKGSIFTEAEDKEVFKFLLNHSHQRDVYNILSQFVRIRSWEFLDDDRNYAEFFSNPAFIRLVGNMAKEDTVKSDGTGVTREASLSLRDQLVDKTFEKLGFKKEEGREILSSWHTFKENSADTPRMQQIGDYYDRSLTVISWLVSHNHTTPHDLYTRFGIRNFHRYNNWVKNLQQQWEDDQLTRVGKDIPQERRKSVSLIVSATDDWNGAITPGKDIQYSLNPVFAEGKTIGEVGKAMARTKKIYGPLKSLIIDAHGNAGGILFHEHVNGGRITKDEVLESKGIGRLRTKDYFLDGSKIMLFSCSTGQKKAIGEVLAVKSQTDVYAPRIPSHTTIKYDYRRGHDPSNPRYKLEHSKDDVQEGVGRARAWILKRRNYTNVHISPDGKRQRVRSFTLPE